MAHATGNQPRHGLEIDRERLCAGELVGPLIDGAVVRAGIASEIPGVDHQAEAPGVDGGRIGIQPPIARDRIHKQRIELGNRRILELHRSKQVMTWIAQRIGPSQAVGQETAVGGEDRATVTGGVIDQRAIHRAGTFQLQGAPIGGGGVAHEQGTGNRARTRPVERPGGGDRDVADKLTGRNAAPGGATAIFHRQSAAHGSRVGAK